MTDATLAELLVMVEPLSRAFSDDGHRLYLVGGVVRDHLLGRPVGGRSDLDLTTDAQPDTVKRLIDPLADAVWTQGERFGTIGCRIDGHIYEVTTHRAERYDPDSRKPDVDFSTSIDDDLSRRDFTVNAMARQLPSGELVDPFGGADDLADHRLRTPLDPELSFTDDPLRMLRAARFVAGYGFEPDAALESAVTTLADRLEIVSAERVRDETLRLLAVPDPRLGLELLVRTGLAAVFWPELATGDREAASAAEPDAIVRMAIILAPVGADAARQRLDRMRWTNRDVASVNRILVGLAALGGTDDESLRRFVVKTRPDTDRAIAVAEALASPQAPGLGQAVSSLLEREGDDQFAAPLSGGELIEHFGLEPGPQVGRAVSWLGDERLRTGPMSRSEALAAVEGWLRDQ